MIKTFNDGDKKNSYEQLKEPIAITKQNWPDNIIPLVSISCITYNHQKYIRDAIEGFLMQKTTFPVEILIHDDASTDNTAIVVREYEKKYPQLIKPIYQTENQYSKHDGTIGRIQRERMQGKYIAICEGDDYWTDPYKLQKQIDFLEMNPEFSMCFHNSLVVYENIKTKPHLFTNIDKEEYGIQDIIENNWFIPTQSIVLRAEFYDKPEWTNYIFGGDIALQLMLATKGKIGVINKTMAIYRKHNTSINANIKVGFHQLKITETLSFFNYYTNFQYNHMIQNKINKIRESLFISFIGQLPFWEKILNPDYYKIQAKKFSLFKRIS